MRAFSHRRRRRFWRIAILLAFQSSTPPIDEEGALTFDGDPMTFDGDPLIFTPA